MHEYPPKLFGIEETEFGSIFTLSDGRKVPINIRPSRLAEALAAYGSHTVADLLARRSLAVFADVLQTSEDEWTTISYAMRRSHAAEAILQQHPTVWSTFHDSYDLLLTKPHRIYGGLEKSLYPLTPSTFVRIPIALLGGVVRC